LKATAWREFVGDVVVVGQLELECLVSLRRSGGAYEQYRWRLDQLHAAEAVKPARPWTVRRDNVDRSVESAHRGA
jgi:hypothetical protein